jgi:hypothetical protein
MLQTRQLHLEQQQQRLLAADTDQDALQLQLQALHQQNADLQRVLCALQLQEEPGLEPRRKGDQEDADYATSAVDYVSSCFAGSPPPRSSPDTSSTRRFTAGSTRRSSSRDSLYSSLLPALDDIFFKQTEGENQHIVDSAMTEHVDDIGPSEREASEDAAAQQRAQDEICTRLFRIGTALNSSGPVVSLQVQERGMMDADTDNDNGLEWGGDGGIRATRDRAQKVRAPVAVTMIICVLVSHVHARAGKRSRSHAHTRVRTYVRTRAHTHVNVTHMCYMSYIARSWTGFCLPVSTVQGSAISAPQSNFTNRSHATCRRVSCVPLLTLLLVLSRCLSFGVSLAHT